MAILLAKPLMPLGAPCKGCCQLWETRVPLSDAITLQSAVAFIAAVGVLNSLALLLLWGLAWMYLNVFSTLLWSLGAIAFA